MKKILVISYFARLPGACQSEWLDDKIDSLVKAGKDIALVSTICAFNDKNESILHSRWPSISIKDYVDELSRMRQNDMAIRPLDLLIIPFVLTFGAFADLLLLLLTRGIGEGRWSWIITGTLGSLFMGVRFRPDLILTTGGPASAHIAGLISAKILNIPLIVEFQDPLSGDGIGRNYQSQGWLYKVEKLIVRYSSKTVYVTRGAAFFASNQFNSKKIVAIYPGAKNFDIQPNKRKKNSKRKFRIVHLGSLYSTRNFKSIISSIDSLVATNKIKEDSIELINLGHVSKDISQEILSKPYVKILPIMSRIDALNFAAKCDLLLLIQNNDERSKVTIPYKTYDYLNLNIKTLALVKSDELALLVTTYGRLAVDLEDVKKIKQLLIQVLKQKSYRNSKGFFIDPVINVKELINLRSVLE